MVEHFQQSADLQFRHNCPKSLPWGYVLILYAKFVPNSCVAGAYQQTTSGLSLADQDCYELDKGCYSIYGFEYKPGFAEVQPNSMLCAHMYPQV
jgi:hypothetical protein